MKIGKYVLSIFLMTITLTACTNAQTADPAAPSDTNAKTLAASDDSDTPSDTADETPVTVTFEATVIETSGRTILVAPAAGSAELNSADQINVPLPDDVELQSGDLVEIAYNGEIMETYPAQLGEIYGITLIQPAQEANLPKTDAESAAETPQTDASGKWDRIPMVMVNDKLYYDTGRESTVDLRCGNMDGSITSSVDGTQSPTKNNESNFGSGFGFQYGTEEDTIEVYMNEKWIIFEHREGTE